MAQAPPDQTLNPPEHHWAPIDAGPPVGIVQQHGQDLSLNTNGNGLLPQGGGDTRMNGVSAGNGAGEHEEPIHGAHGPNDIPNGIPGQKAGTIYREKQIKLNKVYVGGLPEHTRQEDLQSCFGKLGRITSIELKLGYGFVEFETRQAAEESVAKYHEGYFMGNKIRVELSHGGGKTAKFAGEPGACFKCGQQGHWARECPNHVVTINRRANYQDHSLLDRISQPGGRDYGPPPLPPRDYPGYRDDYGRGSYGAPPPPAPRDRPPYGGYDYPPREYRARAPTPPRDYRDYPAAPPPARSSRDYDDYRRDYRTPPGPPPPPPPPAREPSGGYYRDFDAQSRDAPPYPARASYNGGPSPGPPPASRDSFSRGPPIPTPPRRDDYERTPSREYPPPAAPFRGRPPSPERNPRSYPPPGGDYRRPLTPPAPTNGSRYSEYPPARAPEGPPSPRYASRRRSASPPPRSVSYRAYDQVPAAEPAPYVPSSGPPYNGGPHGNYSAGNGGYLSPGALNGGPPSSVPAPGGRPGPGSASRSGRDDRDRDYARAPERNGRDAGDPSNGVGGYPRRP